MSRENFSYEPEAKKGFSRRELLRTAGLIAAYEGLIRIISSRAGTNFELPEKSRDPLLEEKAREIDLALQSEAMREMEGLLDIPPGRQRIDATVKKLKQNITSVIEKIQEQIRHQESWIKKFNEVEETAIAGALLGVLGTEAKTIFQPGKKLKLFSRRRMIAGALGAGFGAGVGLSRENKELDQDLDAPQYAEAAAYTLAYRLNDEQWGNPKRRPTPHERRWNEILVLLASDEEGVFEKKLGMQNNLEKYAAAYYMLERLYRGQQEPS